LIVVIAAIGSRSLAPAGLAPGISPYFVSILVWAIGLSLGGTTGYAINPARDLGPRVAHAVWPISGKGSSDWTYAAIPILGPLVGAVLAAVIIRAAHIA
jgi:glycerol uptake facilitator protein